MDYIAQFQKHIDQEVERRVEQRLQEILAELGITGGMPAPKKHGRKAKAVKTPTARARKSFAEGKACPLCVFATIPPHDARKHKSQKDKRAFTDEELHNLGLKRAGAAATV